MDILPELLCDPPKFTNGDSPAVIFVEHLERLVHLGVGVAFAQFLAHDVAGFVELDALLSRSYSRIMAVTSSEDTPIPSARIATFNSRSSIVPLWSVSKRLKASCGGEGKGRWDSDQNRAPVRPSVEMDGDGTGRNARGVRGKTRLELGDLLRGELADAMSLFLSALAAKPTMFFVEPARFNISPLPSRLALRTSGYAPPCRASASETPAAVHREPRARSASRVRAPDDGLPAAVRARSSLAPG